MLTASLPNQTVAVQVSIRVADLPSDAIVAEHDARGATQAQPDVVLRIPYGSAPSATISARLKGRSFRRLMRQIRQFAKPPERVVLVGRLTPAGELEGAGFLPPANNNDFGDVRQNAD